MTATNEFESTLPGAKPVIAQPVASSSNSHYRSRHRAASHHTAHADSADTQVPEFNHPMVSRGTEPLIANQRGLVDLIDRLRAAGSFAYDSEFIGENSYHPRLCLIQIATTDSVWLIDPMAGLDLTPFWELLADESVEKIVHAGEQDLEPVVRHLNRSARNVFDTQIAAGFAAMAYPCSLAKLVLEFTGVKLGKGLTFTDWSQRPLSNVQLRYAADDVRYLPLIVNQLREKLKPLGYERWARLESESIGDPSRFLFDEDADYLKVRGAGSLPPQNLAVLRELTAWRDQAAQAADAPPRGFMKDDILVALARSPVKAPNQFSRIRGLPRPVEVNEGENIIAATARGLNADVDRLPAKPVEPSPTQRFAADALWAALQSLACGRSIDPNLISSRQEVGELYRHLAAGTDPSALRIIRTWRREAFGDELVALFHGSAHYRMRWSGGLSVSRET